MIEDEGAARERALIEQIRGGDREAFGELVRMHLAAALRLARRVVGHAQDAEDLAQDAFLSALRHIDRFDTGRRFWPWFSRILVNRGLDLLDARKVRSTDDLSPMLADPGDTPDTVVERREVAARFREALATMPPRQRMVMQLFEIDGQSVAEIARTLEMAPDTVRWHLHKGRRALRTVLAPFHDGGEEP